MQRAIGNSGLLVGPVGLGGMPLSIEGRPSEHAATEVIEAFLDGGGDFIDTAISYCLDNGELGHNERLIAKTLARLGRRDVVVATKGGVTRLDGRWDVDCSPDSLRRCCERSARDLGEPIPLYYLHTVDPNVPFADSVGELARLREQGKIAAIGLSNVNSRHLDEALAITPIAAVQNRCNVYDRRDFLTGLVERCRQTGVAYVPYSPAGGHFGHKRLTDDATLAQLAAKYSTTVQAIAIAWLLAKGPHMLPIPGATKTSSVASSLRAGAITLDAEDLERLDTLR